jgi:hypothetical protein
MGRGPRNSEEVWNPCGCKHKWMEAMLKTSLYSYLFPKLSKMISFLLSLMFSLQQNQRREQNRFCWKCVLGRRWEEWEVAQTMYTHVSKCKRHY